MKRIIPVMIIVTLLLLAFCAQAAEQQEAVTGQSFFFGSYEQDNHPENGPEPIEWTVLQVKDGKALLLSRYALDCLPYNTDKTDVTWQDSSIRAWLADDFMTAAFTEEERSAILDTTVINDRGEGNIEWNTPGSAGTTDKVFLLSLREVNLYYQDIGSAKAAGTEYARALGAKFLGITSIGVENTDWWLRSPGANASEAAYIGTLVHSFASKGVSDRIGVRPALWMNLSTDQDTLRYAMSQDAAEKQAAGEYDTAASMFDALGDYWNSANCAKVCRYAQAKDAFDAGEYAYAVTLFEALGSYEDSQALLRDSRYQQATVAQASGDLDLAISLYTSVGQYSDSMSRLKKCLQAKGIQLYYFTEDPVNTGVDIGYSGSAAIVDGDPHFGWSLGRFLITGFTRQTQDENATPVFLKTLGDDVTLWFELQQDIDALNGKKELTINEDINGKNQTFQISPTNFGRGTLIVRHTNYQNDRGEPQIYTNYLKAEACSGANTRVVLHEEGDYEVELNYEIKKDVFPVTCFNYSIRFRFSVRNGNCMVYPFDAVTGGELTNRAVTPNGFYLDLARSRYLDINVRRTMISQDAGGLVEDTRFNRPAKDGDRYTSEGVYTITVSNRYTGETTEKTIFVGSDELLQKYISNGFSADTLN